MARLVRPSTTSGISFRLLAVVPRGQGVQCAGHGLRGRRVLAAERDARDAGPVGRAHREQPRRLSVPEAAGECRRRAVLALRVGQAGAREHHPQAVPPRRGAGIGFGGAEMVPGPDEVIASDLRQCQYGVGSGVGAGDLEFVGHHQTGLGLHGRVVQRSLFEEYAGAGGMPVGK